MKKVINVVRYISDAIGTLFLLMVSIAFYIITIIVLFAGLVVIIPMISIWYAIYEKESISGVFLKMIGGYLSLIKNGLSYIAKELEL